MPGHLTQIRTARRVADLLTNTGSAEAGTVAC